MNEIVFTIEGTHRGKQYNPLPKLKMTGRQHWTDKAKEYVLWKEYVRGCFLVACKEKGILENDALYKNFRNHLDIVDGKPIRKSKQFSASMHIHITWASEVHGDPENIFGSIADSLFEDDKHVEGGMTFEHGTTKDASVKVTIHLHLPMP